MRQCSLKRRLISSKKCTYLHRHEIQLILTSLGQYRCIEHAPHKYWSRSECSLNKPHRIDLKTHKGYH